MIGRCPGARRRAGRRSGGAHELRPDPRDRPDPRGGDGGRGSTPFGAEIDAAAARYGIDPALLRGLVRQESGFDPRAHSPPARWASPS